MILVSMREKDKSGKWIPTAQFDNPGDAYLFCDSVAEKLANMDTKQEEVEGDIYKIVKGESDPRLEMMRLVKEDLNRLDMKEMGKVYKFIRRTLIADIPGK